MGQGRRVARALLPCAGGTRGAPVEGARDARQACGPRAAGGAVAGPPTPAATAPHASPVPSPESKIAGITKRNGWGGSACQCGEAAPWRGGGRPPARPRLPRRRRSRPPRLAPPLACSYLPCGGARAHAPDEVGGVAARGLLWSACEGVARARGGVLVLTGGWDGRGEKRGEWSERSKRRARASCEPLRPSSHLYLLSHPSPPPGAPPHGPRLDPLPPPFSLRLCQGESMIQAFRAFPVFARGPGTRPSVGASRRARARAFLSRSTRPLPPPRRRPPSRPRPAPSHPTVAACLPHSTL